MSYTPGPFLAEHLYLQWGGKLPGNETWSCGMRLIPVGGAVPAESDPTYLTAVKNAVQTFHTTANSGVSARALLSFVKINAITVDGTYKYDTTQEAVLADVAGGSAAADVPNQIALVVSLTTGFSRGPAHAGRIYLPLPVWPVSYDGLISTTNADHTSDTFDTMVAAINAASANFDVGVMSRKSGAPAMRAVTGNKVGRVLDTQRRRRRSLVEDYQ